MIKHHAHPTLVVVTGPTAVGKTCAAIALARYLGTEIISSDSRQVYKELTIGTAVPSEEELELVKHHFIHSHSLFDPLNASRFETEALDLIDDLFRKYSVLIMVGGSMLYTDAVCKGIDVMPDVDPEIRNMLNEKFRSEGIEMIRRQLKILDPEYYAIADLRNPARIIHALEVCLTTGKSYSSFRSGMVKPRPFSIVYTGLNCARDVLHQRINHRVDQMVASGLEQEAEKYYPFRHLTPLNTVGYQEWFRYFDGEINRNEAIELIKRNTRRYARKQISWYAKNDQITWFGLDEAEKMMDYLKTKL